MLSLSSASFFSLAGVSLLAALLTVPFVGDGGAVALLLFVALAAVVAGLSVFGVTGSDAPPFVPADAPGPELVPVHDVETPSGSPWPAAVAVALGVLAAGLALGAAFVLLGIALVVVAGLGWFAQQWQEAPGWTPGRVRRVADRYALPLAIPVLVLVLGAASVVSFSRILLAVSEQAAPLIALVAAVAILAGATFLALRPNVGTGAIWTLAAVAILLVIASGVVGAVAGEREFHHVGGETGAAIEVAAENSQTFTEEVLTAPAETEVTAIFENREVGVPHNLAFYVEQGGEQIAASETITGPAETEFEFTTPEAGEYYFQCDVHPNMNGAFIVDDAPAAEGEGGEGEEEH